MKPLHIALAVVALAMVAAVAYLLHEPSAEIDPNVASFAMDLSAAEPQRSASPLAQGSSHLNVVERIAAPAPPEQEPVADLMPETYRNSLGGIVGRLVEESGDAVPGMMIKLIGGGVTEFLPPLDSLISTGSASIQPELAEAETDDEGRFRFADVEPRILGVLLIDPGGPRTLLHLLEETPVSGREKDLGDIVLPRGVTLTGVVIDEANEPLPGVRVRCTDLQAIILESGIADFRAGGGVLVDEDELSIVVVPPESLQRLERMLPIPTTATDSDGRWTLKGVRPGLVTLVFDDNVHVTTVDGPHPTGDPGGTRDIGETILPDGLTLEGEVMDDLGKPVPFAEVMAGNQLIFGPVAILRPPFLADDQGRFEVTGMRDGLARAAARRSSDHTYTVDVGASRAGEGVITVVLPSRRNLTLVLTDEEGEPVESLKVFARHLPMAEMGEIPDFLVEPRRRTESLSRDEEGRWLLEDLDPGIWDVLLASDGFGSVRNTYDLTHSDLTEQIILHPATSLGVTVVRNDEAATPVEWALVSVRAPGETGGGMRRNGPPQILTAVRSDAEGHVELLDLAAGEYTLEVTHPAYAVTTLPVVVPLLDGEVPLVVLSVGGTVTGNVLENGGPPNQILMVSLRTESDENLAGAMPRMTLTMPDGSFSFSDVEPGDVKLQARERISFRSLSTWWEPFAMTALAEQDIWVTSGQTTEASLVVGSTWSDLETGFVEGRLVVNGRPAAGWKVRTWGGIRRSVTTAPDGTFVMGALEAGRVMLMFYADASSPLGSGSVDSHSFELAVDERQFVDIAISTGSVEGRVLSDINGRPMASANVTLRNVVTDDNKFWGRRGGVTVTDAAGAYHFDVVSEGEYNVFAQAEGYARVSSDPFTVSRLSTARGVNVRLTRAVKISGKIVIEGMEENPSWLWLVARTEDGVRSNTRPDKDTLEFAFDDMSPNKTWSFQLWTNEGEEFEPVDVYIRHEQNDLVLVFRAEVEEELLEETPDEGDGNADEDGE